MLENNNINLNLENTVSDTIYHYSNLIEEGLKERNVYINSSINGTTGLEISLVLKKLDKDNHRPIHLFINSPGGSVLDGMIIIDTMKTIKSPVYTYCMGIAASMGSLILSQGDKRFAYQNSEIMIHQPLIAGGIGGSQSDIEIVAKNLQRTRNHAEKMMANSSKGKSTFEKIHEICEKDTFLTPKEALELGLIDEIVQNAVKE